MSKVNKLWVRDAIDLFVVLMFRFVWTVVYVVEIENGCTLDSYRRIIR